MTNATQTLTAAQRQTRMNIRNFLLTATPDQLRTELALSLQREDLFRADCIREILAEENELVRIETGVINKNNWTGEEANVVGWFNPEGNNIDFNANGYAWRLTFKTWQELDGPNPNFTEKDWEETKALIGSGGWVLQALPAPEEDFGRPTVIEAGKNDSRTPVEVLADAARWVWNYV